MQRFLNTSVHNYIMVTVKCPHCGEWIIINEYLSGEELAKTLNDAMQEIANEQGTVECYV